MFVYCKQYNTIINKVFEFIMKLIFHDVQSKQCLPTIAFFTVDTYLYDVVK